MAMDKNKLIGKAGGMPWYVPGEQGYFKKVTMGKPIIMGRKTFESIGKPLPGRTNIVLTRNSQWSESQPAGDAIKVVHSLDEATELARTICKKGDANTLQATVDEFVVIGGAALCRDAMTNTQRLYLTVIDHAFEGDTWLDSFNWDDWTVVSENPQDPATTDGLNVTYWVLEK